jgi:hypothetical protein
MSNLYIYLYIFTIILQNELITPKKYIYIFKKCQYNIYLNIRYYIEIISKMHLQNFYNYYRQYPPQMQHPNFIQMAA